MLYSEVKKLYGDNDKDMVGSPLPSNRQRLSSDDFLKDKREDCENCSVLYCA